MQSSAQELTEDIQDVPYHLLRSLATNAIDFENFAEWTSQPSSIKRNLKHAGVTFATTFAGQVVNGQISGSLVNEPLELISLSFLDHDYISDILSTGRDHDRYGNFRDSRGLGYQDVFVGGNNRFPANMMTGWANDYGNKMLTSMSPRIRLHSTNSWSDFSVVGIEPITFMFEEDQTAVGFSLINLNRRSQLRWVNSASQSTTIQIKFYRRDGSLISQVSFPYFGTKQVAFARCGQARDIAGIQITNSSQTGLAIDDIIFGMPELVPNTQPDLGINQPETTEAENTNPLGVTPCSYNIS